MADPKLTEKQRRFVEAYMATANATESAKKAGYSGNEPALASAGSRLLRNAKVRAALDERAEGSPDVADRREQQALWTEFLRDGGLSPSERMKAAEMLCKSQGGFTGAEQAPAAPGRPMSEEAALKVIQGGAS